MALVPTSKAFTFFQEFEQWVSIVAINLNLLEARKLCTIVELTEVVPTSANIYEYAMIVKNKAVLRKLIKT